jgi:hypothetical protein
MKMQIFATRDKVKSDTENVRGLNLAAVRLTAVQVTELPLYRELRKIRHDLLYRARTDRGLEHTMYIFVRYTKTDISTVRDVTWIRAALLCQQYTFQIKTRN